jgi:hypothetical protein
MGGFVEEAVNHGGSDGLIAEVFGGGGGVQLLRGGLVKQQGRAGLLVLQGVDDL